MLSRVGAPAVGSPGDPMHAARAAWGCSNASTCWATWGCDENTGRHGRDRVAVAPHSSPTDRTFLHPLARGGTRGSPEHTGLRPRGSRLGEVGLEGLPLLSPRCDLEDLADPRRPTAGTRSPSDQSSPAGRARLPLDHKPPIPRGQSLLRGYGRPHRSRVHGRREDLPAHQGRARRTNPAHAGPTPSANRSQGAPLAVTTRVTPRGPLCVSTGQLLPYTYALNLWVTTLDSCQATTSPA